MTTSRRPRSDPGRSAVARRAARPPGPARSRPAAPSTSRPSGHAPDVHALAASREDQPGDQQRTGREGGQIVMDQLGPEALEQDQRADDPAEQEAEVGIGLAARPGRQRSPPARGPTRDRRPGPRTRGNSPGTRRAPPCPWRRAGRSARPTANRRNSPCEAMLTATNQGQVSERRGRASPHRQWSRLPRRDRPSPPPGQQRRGRDQGRPDRSLGQDGQAEADPEQSRPPAGDGRRLRTQRHAWQPRSQSARVASVVASFDSATTIGAVARIRPASRPAPRTEHPPAQPPDAQHRRRRRRSPRPAGPRTGCRPPGPSPAPSASKSGSAYDSAARR